MKREVTGPKQKDWNSPLSRLLADRRDKVSACCSLDLSACEAAENDDWKAVGGDETRATVRRTKVRATLKLHDMIEIQCADREIFASFSGRHDRRHGFLHREHIDGDSINDEIVCW